MDEQKQTAQQPEQPPPLTLYFCNYNVHFECMDQDSIPSPDDVRELLEQKLKLDHGLFDLKIQVWRR